MIVRFLGVASAGNLFFGAGAGTNHTGSKEHQ